MPITTILYDERVTERLNAALDGEHLWLTPAELETATGWKLETEGLCKGDVCVRTNASWVDAKGRVDLAAFARHLGQPVAREDADGVWALGTSVNARRDSMFSVEAPDFTLPDLNGKLHSLSDYRGKKVFLYSWGSY